MEEEEQVLEIVRNLPASLLSAGVVFQGFCQVFFLVHSLSIKPPATHSLCHYIAHQRVFTHLTTNPSNLSSTLRTIPCKYIAQKNLSSAVLITR